LLEVDQQENVTSIPFEVQVRSAFDHAWSVSTHALTYKSDVVDWKRQRVAAQIKAAVEQLDMLLLAFEHAAPLVEESPYPPLHDQMLIARCVTEFFDCGLLPSELKPKDLSRFAENLYNFLRSGSSRKETQDILHEVRALLEKMPISQVPRSLSLLQFFTALLVSEGLVSGPFRRYCLHLTDELLSLYPALAVLQPRFQYEK
jgi:hypothetical protein